MAKRKYYLDEAFKANPIQSKQSWRRDTPVFWFRDESKNRLVPISRKKAAELHTQNKFPLPASVVEWLIAKGELQANKE